jgi:hypothetical protein
LVTHDIVLVGRVVNPFIDGAIGLKSQQIGKVAVKIRVPPWHHACLCPQLQTQAKGADELLNATTVADVI